MQICFFICLITLTGKLLAQCPVNGGVISKFSFAIDNDDNFSSFISVLKKIDSKNTNIQKEDDNNKNNTIKYNTIPASQYPAENKLDRSAKTIAVSQFLVEQNIDWLRVHDVALHCNLLRFN